MSLDDRIQRLMELLAEVKLRSSQAQSSVPPPVEASVPSFDAETTVVDDAPSDEPPRVVAPEAPRPAPPTFALAPPPPESLSRLIAAPRTGLDYDADGDTKTGLDDDDYDADDDKEDVSRKLRIPSTTIAGASEIDLDAGLTGDGIGELDDDLDSGLAQDTRDLGSGSLRTGANAVLRAGEDRSPASSRRPVLPDDVAPALPDLEWDDTSTSDAPPESGNHVASSAHMLAQPKSESTTLRPPASDARPPPSGSGLHVAPQPPVATFVGTLKEPALLTFGDLLDGALEI